MKEVYLRPSTYGASHTDPTIDDDEVLQRMLEEHMQRIANTIADRKNKIHQFEVEVEELEAESNETASKLKALNKSVAAAQSLKVGKSKGAGVDGGKDSATYYAGSEFEWSGGLKVMMKKVFGIEEFRLCQESVCNASMDGRDIVCVMPTGGGKSLTYQLPALLVSGCTLVISPLVALITDQYLHLREVGVEAVMLTRGTPQADEKDIYRRLGMMCTGELDSRKQIKLCYVTPEKVNNSTKFRNALQKLYDAQKLARIVIDETHCISQLGHDFRQDYRTLGQLRRYFPTVPILAVSATCPPRVLEDVLSVMGMGQVGTPDGTVYFHSPLYRKNLHYRIVLKPASRKLLIRTMVEEIQKKYEGQSGIVYCFSRRDSEKVAEDLQQASGGKIKAGVYHSEVDDSRKIQLHKDWRDGKIQIVCATIAFGLGIDKSDVRFVFHHSMSKSIDGFYQESGRAGRDGKDADCVMFARPQDFINILGLIQGEAVGTEKVTEMLKFTMDMMECRKIALQNYFLDTSHIAIQDWRTSESESALNKCGHCDNCTRHPDSFADKDVTMDAFRIIKTAEHIKTLGGRVTLSALADIVRGVGKKTMDVMVNEKGGGKWQKKREIEIDVTTIVDGKVLLKNEEAETLIAHLIVHKYLAMEFVQSAYAGANVYLKPGLLSARFSLLKQEQVDDYRIRVICSFPMPLKKLKKKQKQQLDAQAEAEAQSSPSRANSEPAAGLSKALSSSVSPKRKRKRVTKDDDEDETNADDSDFVAHAYGKEVKVNSDYTSRLRSKSVRGGLSGSSTVATGSKKDCAMHLDTAYQKWVVDLTADSPTDDDDDDDDRYDENDMTYDMEDEVQSVPDEEVEAITSLYASGGRDRARYDDDDRIYDDDEDDKEEFQFNYRGRTSNPHSTVNSKANAKKVESTATPSKRRKPNIGKHRAFINRDSGSDVSNGEESECDEPHASDEEGSPTLAGSPSNGSYRSSASGITKEKGRRKGKGRDMGIDYPIIRNDSLKTPLKHLYSAKRPPQGVSGKKIERSFVESTSSTSGITPPRRTLFTSGHVRASSEGELIDLTLDS